MEYNNPKRSNLCSTNFYHWIAHQYHTCFCKWVQIRWSQNLKHNLINILEFYFFFELLTVRKKSGWLENFWKLGTRFSLNIACLHFLNSPDHNELKASLRRGLRQYLLTLGLAQNGPLTSPLGQESWYFYFSKTQ